MGVCLLKEGSLLKKCQQEEQVLQAFQALHLKEQFQVRHLKEDLQAHLNNNFTENK